MDPFSEQTSAFDADPASSLPSAQDLIGDSIDAETHEEPAPAAAASSFPPVFAMPDANDAFSAASPLPTLVDSTPLRFALENTNTQRTCRTRAYHIFGLACTASGRRSTQRS